MADIKLRIEVNPDGETTLGAGDGKEKLGTIVNKTNDTGTNSNLSNTSFKASSKGVFENLPTERVSGSNGLSMASDDGSDAYDFIFNDSDELDNADGNGAIVEDEQNPSEFIWGIVPSNKQYSVKLTFTNATSLKDIVIYGDTEVGQFPTKAIIDGTRTIYSDDAKWAINMQVEKDTHTIEFLEWNRANYNACISNIRVMLRYFDLDRGWIDSVESLSQTTSDPSSIQYGVIANSGSANLRDVDGELKDLIIDEVIPNSNVPVELFVNGNKVQCHITTDSDYVEEDKMLSVQLSNSFANFDGDYKKYTFYSVQDESAYDITLYRMLRNFLIDNCGFDALEVDNALTTKIIYGNENTYDTIKSYIDKIRIFYRYIPNGNKKEIVNKFCNIAQIGLIKDENNKFKFISLRPIASSLEILRAIKIPKSHTINNVEKSIFLTNKYDNVRYYENKIQEEQQNVDDTTIIYNTITKTSNPEDAVITDVFLTKENPWQNSSSIVVDPSDNAKYQRTIVVFDISNQFMSTKNLMSSKLVFNNTMTDIGMSPTQNQTWNNSTTQNANMQRDYGGNKIINYENGRVWIRIDEYISGSSSLVISPYGIKTNANIQLLTICGKSSYSEKLFTTSQENVFTLEQNEFLQTKSTYSQDYSIINLICNNVLSDYANGVSNATVDTFCGDFYNANGDKIIDWSKGEIVRPYDIVYFEGDTKADGSQRYWRVTGRHFKYSGSPTVSLELQEIAKIY